MSRAYCTVCQRPKVNCICHLFQTINNDIEVVILQHPSEVKQTKGTVTLLANSLTNCQVLVGEKFAQDQELSAILARHQGATALLYPSEQGQLITEKRQFTIDNQALRCMILLDGTWKKAYRLFMLNEFLHPLPHIVLPPTFQGRYQIRSTKKQGALSTLEACCHALALLEQSSDKYQPLLKNFERFNQQQMSFHPIKQ